MKTTTRKVFAFVNMEAIKNGTQPENSICLSELDYRLYETLGKNNVFISEHEVTVLIPDNVAEISADKMVEALAKMRAEHHQKQQELIDTISSLRMLAAPKEGQIVDDTDLRQPKVSRFSDAAGAEVVHDDQPLPPGAHDLEIPF